MHIVKILIVSLALTGSMTTHATERSDIHQVLKEINYTKEVVKKLKRKYGNNKSKVRFNYEAMLKQLIVMENGIKEYLNLNINTLHSTPPKPLINPLYRVRKN